MTFKKLLVALDGSKNSQIAAEYGFWLASKLDAELAGQHVVDPRLVDLFIEPEFGEELGFTLSVDTHEKVFRVLRKIGKIILQRFTEEAKGRGLDVETHLDEGHIVESVIEYGKKFDLTIIGHRGKGDSKRPSNLLLGSVAERVTISAETPVLIAVQPLDQIDQVLVAYDGSEAARGALLMAENFAKNAGVKLKAMTVYSSFKEKKEAEFLVEQGESFLREYWQEDVFSMKQGCPGETLLESVANSNSLLVIGAYGYREPDRSVLGSTAAKIIRETDKSVLIYRPSLVRATKQKEPAVKVKSR